MTDLETRYPAFQRQEHSQKRTDTHAKSTYIRPYHSQVPQNAIGRYEIIYPIAAGGMASVYTGRLSGMAGFERLFAIKVIHPHLAAERSFIEMFLDEARLAGRIHHPNVAEIFEVGEENGLYYMVGELVLGQDLKRLADTAHQKDISIPRPIIANIIANVARGLHEAHELRDEDGEPSHLVHRDISTQNILISYKGYTKLIDFGVAWARGRIAHTRDGSQKGKVGYMPPEQLRGEQIDRRSDVYALGVVLYTVIVGTHPFPYDNEGEQVAKMLAGDFALPRSVNPAIERSLERIIIKAMAKNPDDRYNTAAEMGKALSAFVEVRMMGKDPTRQLAELMQTLFQDKIRQHEDNIRQHRRKDSQKEQGIPSSITPVPSRSLSAERHTAPSRITEVILSDDEIIVNTGPGIPERSGNKRHLLKRVTIPAILLVALSLLYFAPFRKEPSRIIPLDDAKTPMINREVLISGTKDIPFTAAPAESQVTIFIEGTIPKSTAFLDGKETPLPIRTVSSTKPVQLRIETPGYETFETALTPDKNRTLLIALKKESRPTPEAKKRRQKRQKKRVTSTNHEQKPNPSNTNTTEWERNPFL